MFSRWVLLINFLSLFICTDCYSQSQAIFKKYTPDSTYVYSELLYAADDSTFFLAGGQQYPSHGTHVTKFDMNGVPSWSKRYAFPTYERYPSIHETPWGDLIITTYPPNLEPRVRCVDNNGNYKWGSVSGFLQRDFDATSFDDSTLFIIHESSGGVEIIKTTYLGAVLWKKSYNNIPMNAFDLNENVRINETSILLAGFSQTYNATIVMHIDSTGMVISSEALSPALSNAKFYRINNNKFWLSGTIGTNSAIVEFDSTGTFQWATKIINPFGSLGTLSLNAFSNGQVAFGCLYADTLNIFRGSCSGILNPDATVAHAFRFGADDSLFTHDNTHAVAMKNGKVIVGTFERILPVNSLAYSIIGIIDSAYSGAGSCYTAPIQLINDTISFTSLTLATLAASSTTPAFFFSPFGVVNSVPYDSLLCNSVTSIDELFPEPDILIYPNPATDIITMKGTIDEGIVEIIDITGRICSTTLCENEITMISVHGLRPGIYCISFYNGTFRHIQKLVIL